MSTSSLPAAYVHENRVVCVPCIRRRDLTGEFRPARVTPSTLCSCCAQRPTPPAALTHYGTGPRRWWDRAAA